MKSRDPWLCPAKKVELNPNAPFFRSKATGITRISFSYIFTVYSLFNILLSTLVYISLLIKIRTKKQFYITNIQNQDTISNVEINENNDPKKILIDLKTKNRDRPIIGHLNINFLDKKFEPKFA